MATKKTDTEKSSKTTKEKSKTSKTSKKPQRIKREKFRCTDCENDYTQNNHNFFTSDCIVSKNGFYPMCKKCLIQKFIDEKNNSNIRNALIGMCSLLDRPFIQKAYMNVLDKERDMEKILGAYFKECSMRQWRVNGITNFKHSQYNTDNSSETYNTNDTNNDDENSNRNIQKITEDDKKNEKYTINVLKYDPFEYENEIDRKHLFNKLADCIDESTLQDSFKLPIVIEIVKTFHQIDKINMTISNIFSDPELITENIKDMKELILAKDRMVKGISIMAKDNGISINYSNNKSKGAGTLTGIIKDLQEKGFDEADVNLFDIETANGIKQVANISNESIKSQLLFDENDYTNMINDQKEIIENLDEELMNLKEENRILKIELFNLKKSNNENDSKNNSDSNDDDGGQLPHA